MRNVREQFRMILHKTHPKNMTKTFQIQRTWFQGILECVVIDLVFPILLRHDKWKKDRKCKKMNRAESRKIKMGVPFLESTSTIILEGITPWPFKHNNITRNHSHFLFLFLTIPNSEKIKIDLFFVRRNKNTIFCYFKRKFPLNFCSRKKVFIPRIEFWKSERVTTTRLAKNKQLLKISNYDSFHHLSSQHSRLGSNCSAMPYKQTPSKLSTKWWKNKQKRNFKPR